LTVRGAVEETHSDMQRPALAALLAIGLAAAGCGGSSSSDKPADFKTSFSSTANQMEATAKSIVKATQSAPSTTDSQLATEFHGFAKDWQKELSSLQTLKPPANVAKAYTKMTGAAGRAESDLTAIVTGIGTRNKTALEHAASNMIVDIAATKDAATTITKSLGIK